MRRLHGFKSWLIESVLQQEAVVRFGTKFRDKDVNNVPPSFWSWLVDAMADKPGWTPNVEDDDGGFLSRDQVIQLAQTRASNRKFGNAAPARAPQPARPAAQPPREGPRPLVPNSAWILAKVVKVPGLPAGEHVVVTRNGNDWTLMTRDGETKKISGTEIRTAVSSMRDHEDKPITDNNPEKLWALVQKEGPMPEPRQQGTRKVNPHILGEDKLKQEQLAIDQRFEKMMASKTQDHMMINALAGTGKTTILKHLAWKYGNKNQKWLYLVFNTKNRVEAEEYKDGFRKFPEWVDVYTTNSYLGHLLKSKENLNRIPQTTLMAKLAQGKGSTPEKIREIVDFNPEFQHKLESYGILTPTVITPEILERYGGIFGRDQKYYMSALKGILTAIRSQFKERVLTLNGLLKSFAVNPDSSDLEGEVRKVFDKYDVAKNDYGEESGYFDTSLEEVKERIAKYDPRFRGVAMKILGQVLGYNFMDRDYKEEIIEAATWLLHKTLPHAISQNYTHGKGDAAIDYELGEFRDFNDDLWYSAIFSDKLHWDKYDVVLADEVQDFNMGQMVMLKKLHDAGAKIVAVGDPNQAIYRFRGADNDAFSNLSKMLGDLSHTKEGWKEHTLSQNFRSRKGILDFVNNRTHVKDLVAGKEFKDGNDGVVTDRDMSYNDVFELLKEEHKSNRLKDTAFIARTNDPLVHAGLRLLGEGVPFIIVGKDVAGNLIKHIEWLMRDSGGRMSDRLPVKELRKSLINHEESENDRHSGKATKKNYLNELSNTTLALTSSIDKFLGKNPDQHEYEDEDDEKDDPTKTIGNFKKWLEAKLNGFEVQDDEGDLKNFKAKREKEHPVVLTTSHKSKGLEFSRVFILRADQFPSPRAKHPEELAQEDNTEYVAYTRAMDELHIVKLEGQPGYKD